MWLTNTNVQCKTTDIYVCHLLVFEDGPQLSLSPLGIVIEAWVGLYGTMNTLVNLFTACQDLQKVKVEKHFQKSNLKSWAWRNEGMRTVFGGSQKLNLLWLESPQGMFKVAHAGWGWDLGEKLVSLEFPKYHLYQAPGEPILHDFKYAALPKFLDYIRQSVKTRQDQQVFHTS